jgi:hypothetical protein
MGIFLHQKDLNLNEKKITKNLVVKQIMGKLFQLAQQQSVGSTTNQNCFSFLLLH